MVLSVVGFRISSGQAHSSTKLLSQWKVNPPFAQYGDTKEIEEIQTLLNESVKASCQGLMVKMLDPEERGYEPSKRSRNWLKVKKDSLSGIGDSLDLVVLGAHGKGKRTSWYGAFLLAAYNPTTQNYETVCNIGTGFSEQILEEPHTHARRTRRRQSEAVLQSFEREERPARCMLRR